MAQGSPQQTVGSRGGLPAVANTNQSLNPPPAPLEPQFRDTTPANTDVRAVVAAALAQRASAAGATGSNTTRAPPRFAWVVGTQAYCLGTAALYTAPAMEGPWTFSGNLFNQMALDAKVRACCMGGQRRACWVVVGRLCFDASLTSSTHLQTRRSSTESARHRHTPQRSRLRPRRGHRSQQHQRRVQRRPHQVPCPHLGGLAGSLVPSAGCGRLWTSQQVRIRGAFLAFGG